MGLGKRLEILAKYLLALAARLLLWRPSRAARVGRLEVAKRILLVRVDNRVGEALLMTPLLATLKGMPRPPRVDVLLHRRAARVLEGHPLADRVIGLDRRWLALGAWAPGLKPLRRQGYDVVVDCGNWEVPSVTSALVSRLAGPTGCVVGPAIWPVAGLHDVPVPAKPGTRNELSQRLHLLSPLAPRNVTTELSVPVPALQTSGPRGPAVIVNPGGRLDWRRVPPATFAAAARAALAAGRTPWITWGPGEEALAREVVAAAPGAVLAPPTDLGQLAALMKAAGAVVCNNTGPMHLAVAAGAPVLAFFLKMDVERWGYAGAPNRMVDLTALADSGPALEAAAAKETAGFLRQLGA